MKIQTPCLVWWLITGAYGGKVLANGQIQLFSNDFQNVLSQNFIDCADNIELNLKFDEINKESSIVDYHRCETFDNFESCCCSFLDKIKALCQGEDENVRNTIITFAKPNMDYTNLDLIINLTDLVFRSTAQRGMSES